MVYTIYIGKYGIVRQGRILLCGDNQIKKILTLGIYHVSLENLQHITEIAYIIV